ESRLPCSTSTPGVDLKEFSRGESTTPVVPITSLTWSSRTHFSRRGICSSKFCQRLLRASMPNFSQDHLSSWVHSCCCAPLIPQHLASSLRALFYGLLPASFPPPARSTLWPTFWTAISPLPSSSILLQFSRLHSWRTHPYRVRLSCSVAVIVRASFYLDGSSGLWARQSSLL